MNIGRTEDDLEIVPVDRLKIVRLKEQEGFKVRLNVEEPRRQAIVQD